MSNLEDTIRQAFGSVDTTELDRRVDREIAAAQALRPSSGAGRVPWWFVFVTSVACVVAGYAVGRSPAWPVESDDPSKAVVIEVSPQFERWLTARAACGRPPGETRTYEGIETVFVGGASTTNSAIER